MKCSICNKTLDDFDTLLNAKIRKTPTYGSRYDGENLSYDFCTECFDNIIDYIKKQ